MLPGGSLQARFRSDADEGYPTLPYITAKVPFRGMHNTGNHGSDRIFSDHENEVCAAEYKPDFASRFDLRDPVYKQF